MGEILKPCVYCGAPCRDKVLMRGGDNGWGDDKSRTVQRYVAPTDHAARVAKLEADRDAWKHDAQALIQINKETLAALERAEAEAGRLRELLGEARDYVSDALVQERAAYKGYEHMSSIVEIETDLAKIDAALKDDQ